MLAISREFVELRYSLFKIMLFILLRLSLARRLAPAAKIQFENIIHKMLKLFAGVHQLPQNGPQFLLLHSCEKKGEEKRK